jgi:hypothetical protein
MTPIMWATVGGFGAYLVIAGLERAYVRWAARRYMGRWFR